MDNHIRILERAALAEAAASNRGRERSRIRAAGKFLWDGNEKFWVKGVTYGTFRPSDGGDYPSQAIVEADFAAAVANGINAIRTYTAPPLWLLDTAHRHGLRVLVGIEWEQHLAFLDDKKRVADIVGRVRAAVRRCTGHPAILCYAVGNEIPSSIVRWFGRRRIERFIRRLYDVVKQEDAASLVTYVNFPTTEYLQLPFLDLVCFNVYLESRRDLSAYLARVQNLAGERPLLLAEIGLDSRRHGEKNQATSIAWQLCTAFAEGCAGAFVFAWTDEWHRGGHDIEDWDFGLTTRQRHAKPALATLRQAFATTPFTDDMSWPRISVVVCSFNGARTIRDTLEGLQRLDYPDLEVIVVNDGSTDDTPQIASEYPVRLISTANHGLSSARNTGWMQASGQIVAYIDDDAYPDPHWLRYLAFTFLTTSYVGVGGPNLAPPGDGPIADCVANAPGGPVHVLISDREAEHIPGCNMAFRRSALEAVCGFDPRYRTAGDDVDVCWRLQERGWKIGFHAAAMVWHHRRNSLRMFWRQQRGYGKAEALLEQKWPQRYNALGHLAWGGQLYGRGFTLPIPLGRSRVYGGVWGSAAYQSLYEPTQMTLLWLPLMPEWYFVIAALAVLSLLGLSWPPLLWALPLLVLAAAAPITQAAIAATRAQFPVPAKSSGETARRWVLTFYMHLMQPLARLIGRLEHGLTPWRRRGTVAPASPWKKGHSLWSEQWHAQETWIANLEASMRAQGAIVARGGGFDRWDLQVRGGLFGSILCLIAVEEHGAGRQMVRAWSRACVPPTLMVAIGLLSVLAIAACSSAAWGAAAGLSAMAAALIVLSLRDLRAAAGTWMCAIEKLRPNFEGSAP